MTETCSSTWLRTCEQAGDVQIVTLGQLKLREEGLTMHDYADRGAL